MENEKNKLPVRKAISPLSVKVRSGPVVLITAFTLFGWGVLSILQSGFGLFAIISVFIGTILVVFNLLSKKNTITDLPEESHLKNYTRYISKTQYLQHVGDLGDKTAAQLFQISDRFEKFQDLLAIKFSQGELTYSRYFSAAEQTYLSILDNLHSIASKLNNISTIDPHYIEQQLKVSSQKEALQQRKSFREQQMSNVEEILSFNERAITEFDRVSTALTLVKTQRGHSELGLEEAMAELTELANRAKKYSISGS